MSYQEGDCYSSIPVESSQQSMPEDSNEENSHVILGKRKKLTGDVWDQFEKKQIDDGTDKAICHTNKRKLGDECKNEISYVFDQDVARRELANMIILHEYPLSIVDHIGFRRYSSALQPLFTIPSRNTVKSDILKIYDCERSKTMKLLDENKSRVAITTDMWTSSNKKEEFMAVTGHFIDDSFCLQSRILRFVYAPHPCTQEVLCEALLQTLFEWNVDRKLSTITVDNCSANDAMIDILGKRLRRSSLMLDGSLLYMRCCALMLNLLVNDGLDVIKGEIKKVRDSVAFWRGTPEREEKFENFVRYLHTSSPKQLRLDCVTRWNSTYLMLQTALDYRNIFVCLKLREPEFTSCPTEEEWEFTKETCEKLKLFYNVAKLFFGSKYPTANLYFPKICEIKMELNKWLTCSSELIRDMAKNMTENFDKYWSMIYGIMGVAAVLDPRYKMDLIEYYFSKVFGSEAFREIEKVSQLCYDLLREYHFRAGSDSSLASTSCSSKINEIGDALSDYDVFVRTKKKSVNVRSELDHYLEEGVLPRTPDFDILAWWKSSGLRYPTLQAIARDIFAIPVSTVASDSAFSTSGRLVGPHRSRLHSKTLETLMCTQNWLWATEMQGETIRASHGYATIWDDEDGDDSFVNAE